MGFPIPDPYLYDESFRTFYNNIDNEHKGLFAGVFAVSAFPNSRRALRDCQRVMASHFANEEGMMLRSHYAGFPEHKALHKDFLGKLNGLVAPVAGGDIDFLKDWLVQHVKTVDFKYKGNLL